MDLTTRQGRALNREGLFAVFSGDGAYGVPDAVRATEHAGFTAQFGPLELADLDPVILPVLVPTTDGGAFNILDRKGRQWRIWSAEGGERLIGPKELRRLWTGHVLRLTLDTTPTGDKGHWFRSVLREHRWTYMQVLIAAAVSNILGLSTSLFTMVVYDRVLPNEAIESLIALTIGIGIALGFDLLIKSLRARFLNTAGRVADRKMAQRIFDRILALKLGPQVGNTGALSNALREFESLRDFFTSATVIAIVDLPFVALYIFVIWMIGGPLALVAGGAVPIVLIVALGVQPFLRRLAEASREEGQSKQSVLVEAIGGLPTIKVTGAAPWMRARWDRAVSHQADHAARARDLSQGALNLTGFVQQSAQVLIVFFGVFLIREGVVSMGALIACVILTGRTLGPLAQIASVLTRISQASSAYRSIDALMRAEVDRPVDRAWLSRPVLRGAVAFEDVSFGYPGPQGPVLLGLNFRIEPGEKVAIIGPVGSGKSTLASLITGLAEPTEGRVLLDGTDRRAIDPGDLRRNIGVQLQDVWLFSGTVKENILAGRRGVSDEHLLTKARLAAVDPFVRKHPLGYDLPLGERGQGLSGGQRQCIALARALVGDPPLMVLDEPTANMDVQTEDAVLRALRTELKHRTVLLITHRTSALSLVDRVIVIEEGKVGFDGPRAQLMARLKGGKS